MTDLTKLTIAELRDGYQAGTFTSLEATQAYIDAIDAHNAAFNAYIAKTPDIALAQAAAADARLATGDGGALEGIPLGIKDLYATRGVHTQACSHILDGFQPPYESTVTQNLLDGCPRNRREFCKEAIVLTFREELEFLLGRDRYVFLIAIL